jgi:hypothetical protein
VPAANGPAVNGPAVNGPAVNGPGRVTALVVAPAGGTSDGLDALLLQRARQAAERVPGAGVEVVAGEDVRRRAAEVLAEEHPRLLILWPRLGRWREDHVTAALEDLDAGCGVSLAPLFDGGLYLLALDRMVPELFGLEDEVIVGPRAMGELLGAAGRAGVEVGLLRAERALRRPGDVAAALADPLLDAELRGLLSA